MDPRNGEILAMVSRPTLIPTDFCRSSLRATQWSQAGQPMTIILAKTKRFKAQLAPVPLQNYYGYCGLQEGIAQTCT